MHDVLKAPRPKKRSSLAARAARCDTPDRQPGLAQPRTYVTEISVPRFGDSGVQRLHAPMKQPEPDTEPEAGI